MDEFSSGTVIKFDLVQQTPMIHFQAHEDGVCLRGSEVKPKLDRFLLKLLGDSSYDTGVAKAKKLGWLVGNGDHPALDYKLRIETDQQAQLLDPYDKLFFGNTGEKDDSKKKRAIMLSSGGQSASEQTSARLSIICRQKNSTDEPKIMNGSSMDLKEFIAYCIPYFFALTTFGTRSGKGFGSFFVKNEPKDLFANLSRFCGPFYYVEYRMRPDHTSFFEDIWVISGMMKSGFNLTRINKSDYYKGRIFRYFSNRKIGSDKAFIKQQILTKPRNADNTDKSEENVVYEKFYFTRALLGLAQEYQFRSGNDTTRRGTVKFNYVGKEGSSKEKKIERFQSPIYFKPHKNRLLILVRGIPDLMFDATFQFESRDSGRSAPLKTPASFDLFEYMDWFRSEFNSKKEINKFIDKKVARVINKNLQILKAGGGGNV